MTPMKNIKVKFYSSLIFLQTALFLLILQDYANAQAADLFAGVAQVEITPPEGHTQYRGPATGVKNPLYAKAIVFHHGDEKAALVVCDLIRITRELSTEVRTLVAEQAGIPYENIIVAATHTHTGPVYRFDLKEYVGRKREGDLSEEDKKSYSADLIQDVAQAAVKANNAAMPINLESGTGIAEDISFNRRFIMKDGRVRFNPGVGNPNAIRPEGPNDPEVGIIVMRRASDNLPIASLTGFANHTDTVGGTEFSADYPFYLARALNAAFGEDFISIFGQGTSGNLNHIDVVDGSHQKGPGTVTQRIGEKLAEVVKEEISELKKSEYPSLAARSEFVYAPLQQYTKEELLWAQKEEREPLYEERPFLQNVRARKIRWLKDMKNNKEVIPPTSGTGPWTLPLEVQVFRVGEDAAIVGLPGEVFVELGLAIKEASPFETTLVVEMTNININYVPTRKAFTHGDYETVNSRLAPGGGEMMVESAVRMLNELMAELTE